MLRTKSGMDVGQGMREIRLNSATGMTTVADTILAKIGLDSLVLSAPSDKRIDPKPRLFRYLRPTKIAAAAPNGSRMYTAQMPLE